MVVRDPVSNDQRPRSGRFSLRLSVTVPFLLLILLTSGLIAFLSLRNGSASVQVLADDLHRHLLAWVEKDLRHYLKMPHMLNAVNARLILNTPGLLKDFDRLRHEYLAGLHTFDSVMATGVGIEPDGEFLGVGRREEGGFDMAMMRLALGGGYRHIAIDEQGNPGRILKVMPNYDARQRDWYRTAVRAGGPAWSPVYIWAAQTRIGITAVLPLHDEGGKLLGVQQSAFSLGHLSRFARSLTGGYAGQAFIMERSGFLVASSADEQVVARDAGGGLARMSAEASGDPLVREGAKRLAAHFGDFNRVSEDFETGFDLAGERHLMRTRVFSDGYGLEWIAAIVVPEGQFLAQVRSGFHTTIALCVTALVLAILVGLFISHRITRPILRLKEAARDLARGKWEPGTMPVDRGDELGELASSFTSMAVQQRELVSTLEKRVAERTETLAAANAHLQEEIAERRRVESSLRRSEERFQLAFKASNEALWDLDLMKREAYLSPRWRQMLGKEEAETTRGLDQWKDVTHPEDVGRVAAELEAALNGLSNSFEVEFRHVREDGRVFPVRGRGFILRDERGRAVRVVGTTTDLSERKRVEEERARWERRLEQARRAEGLGRMAGAIAHHFNNMLGAIMGNLELALLELPRGTETTWITAAMKASRRAAEISRLMLTYVGKVEARKEPLDLSEALRQALELLRTSLPAGIDMMEDLPRSGPVLSMDGTHLNQIITNLVLNAGESMADGKGRIRVSLGVLDQWETGATRYTPEDWEPEQGAHACITVEDTGSGMDAATREKIFDPFFSTRFTGRGLGLSVVLGLVRSYRGAVTVESSPGTGSVFRIYLPLPERGTLRVSGGNGDSRRTIPVSGLVLLVEDEPLMASMARAMLERLGHGVVTVVDGVEALDAFETRPNEFLCVLLDLTLPGMDGWEILVALRKIRPGLPVVLASGYDQAEVMTRKRAETPQIFLQKPYELKTLREAIEAAVATSSAG